MPAKARKEHLGATARKKAQLANSKSTAIQQFTTVDEIHAGLRTENHDILIKNLSALRNQLSRKAGEGALSPLDERLLLVQHWLESIPGAHNIFETWDSQQMVNQSQYSILALIVAVLSSLLNLLSSLYTFHALGQPILKTLLTPTYIRRLNSYLGGSNHELILVTLRLFNEMSAFAGGREKKAVLESFGWEIKSLPKLLTMRRKAKSDNEIDFLQKPDIRTFYILFLLSFITSDSSTQVKTVFLEQRQAAFLSIFKGLAQDPFTVVRKVLELSWVDIWSDPKIKRTLKIGLFNESIIAQIVKLYERNTSEHSIQDHVPADIAHHFLLAICTRPGVGICFKDKGWYPRETDEGRFGIHGGSENEEDALQSQRGKIYNKILANVVKILKVNEDLRQQELTLRILAACPELVASYWSGAALTLEPRLSSKWVANIAFFGSIISLPVPESCFFIPSSSSEKLYNPSPPPLSSILGNTVPSVNTKSHFSKGLQSASPLVQHCTAIALARCLVKYEGVSKALSRVEEALGEPSSQDSGYTLDMIGQWGRRRKEMERELRKRVPEFQVIVAFSQQHRGDSSAAAVPSPTPTSVLARAPNLTREAFLAESAQRLLYLYQRCLPGLVAEARFDVGKVLQGFVMETSSSEQETDGGAASRKLRMVRQLHVLRFLKDNDQFTWSGKMSSSSQSYLAVLFRAFTSSSNRVMCDTLSALLEQVLSQSIMFQEDPTEIRLWLISFPTSCRASGTESPDGAVLTDEAQGVIQFLDDCIQRCLKTPYRYIDELHTFAVDGGQSQDSYVRTFNTGGISPLVMTVLEQLEIKVSKKLLTPSDVLALATFLRKLGFRLTSKSEDQALSLVQKIWKKIDFALGKEQLFEEFPVLSNAVRREVRLLGLSIGVLVQENPKEITFSEESSRVLQAVTAFLTSVEEMPLPKSDKKRIATTTELIDWLRLVNENLRTEDLQRVAAILNHIWFPSVIHFIQNVNPATGNLWNVIDIRSRFDNLRPLLQFDFLFLHSSETEFLDEQCREILSEVALGTDSPFIGSRRVVVMILQKISSFSYRDDVIKGLFLLLASVLNKTSLIIPIEDYASLKELIFARSAIMRSYLMNESLTDTIQDGLHFLIRNCLDPMKRDDQLLVGDICTFWFDMIRSSLPEIRIPIPLVSVWIHFFPIVFVSDLLGTMLDDLGASTSASVEVLEELFVYLHRAMTFEPGAQLVLRTRLSQLLTYREKRPGSPVLEEIIAIGIEASLPLCVSGVLSRRKISEYSNLTLCLRHSQLQWSHRSCFLAKDVHFRSFLTQSKWTAATVDIISGMIYRRLFSGASVLEWLESEDPARLQDEHFSRVFHAFLDVRFSDGRELPTLEIWTQHFSRLLQIVCNDHHPRSTRSMAGSCIPLLANVVPSGTSLFQSTFMEALERLSVTTHPYHLFCVARQFRTDVSSTTEPLITALVEHGIQWAIRIFGDEMIQAYEETIDVLTSLVQQTQGMKAHLAETLLWIVVQNYLSNVHAVDLAVAIVSCVHLKPVVINRLLQSIVQHGSFFKYCSHASLERDGIVNLLHIMFGLHPTNTCQVTHVEPLVQIYRGTLSPADGKLLTIFKLFETERRVSIGSLLGSWSPSGSTISSTPVEATQGLDPALVLRTCLNFPRWRKLTKLETEKATLSERDLYDPVFLILLFAQILVEDPPTSKFVWVELFRSNIVSLLIVSLSSKDDGIRNVALSQLAALWRRLETVDLHEKAHVDHILALLKDTLPVPSSDEAPKRLSFYTTLLLAHAMRALFYPSNFIYPITSRFLLQRPGLDIKDVPMLYGMLYSSSDDWKKERSWIIRFLSDGMLGSEDWKVFKGRHTWDLLASLYQTYSNDRGLRNGIFGVLANLTRNAQATTSLVLKSGLLAWIEMQLVLATTVVEGVEWVKILSNIMIVANPTKMEASTGGSWRPTICRCLSMLLDDEKTNTAAVFPFAAPTVLRLTLLPGSTPAGFSCLLDRAFECLTRMEASIRIPPDLEKITPMNKSEMDVLYHAHDVHDGLLQASPLAVWGACTEALWRATMMLTDQRSRAWDVLTSRLLVWRALVGAEGTALGEWARVQTVHNLGEADNDLT